MVKNRNRKSSDSSKPLSTKRKVLFYTITFSLPVIFFVALELILRSVNYMGDTRLFVDPGIPTNEYLIPNPNFSARYFFYTNTIPNPSSDVFLKEKPENGLRIFAMGGSSAAGYPYGYNSTYSRIVRDVLEDAMPDREVEVVNLGISAISSYTLFDQVDEIIEQKPDAILIYAGHNEFYGALGVGSNENLGGFPGFVRLYLKLQRFKTFMFIRTIIVDSGKWISQKLGREQTNQNATLMERIIDSRSIELKGPKYELAMHQFRSNIEKIVELYEVEGIPVYIGSIASNVKDQPPFVNITDGEQPPAQSVYDEALHNFKEGKTDEATEQFELAKDLDGLKFRAPSEINSIIRNISETYQNTTYVPSHEALTSVAEDGIIGNDLMLEHLHPNQTGYYTIGITFAKTVVEDFQPDFSLPNNDLYKDRMYFSEFDHRVAWHRIRTLKQGFPFILENKPRPYQDTYQPVSVADSLAFMTVHLDKRWDASKVELADFYEKQRAFDKAILEYRGLIRNQPWNDSPYIFAARIYLDQGRLTEAEPLLEKAYEIIPDDPFTTKMLGAIQVQKGNAEKAIELLEKSRSLKPNDSQTLYNLSGAYFNNKQYEKAIEIADEVIRLNPNFPGIQQWRRQLESLRK